MQICNYCRHQNQRGKSYRYCSKKCEIKAVQNGLPVENSGGSAIFSGVIFIIAAAIFFFTIQKTYTTKSDDKNDTIEQFESSASNENELIEEQNDNVESTAPTSMVDEDSGKNENVQNEIPIKSSADERENLGFTDRSKSPEATAISLLREGNTVREVADSTGLSKSEVRKLKRSLN